MKSRLRLIAGPNGSGKTTLTNSIRQKLDEKFGIYINADEIEKSLRDRLTLDFSDYSIAPNAEEFNQFYLSHPLYDRAITEWQILDTLFMLLKPLPKATYFATLFADFIREQLLRTGASFAFETVMSEAGKVDLLKRAKAMGYRTYLYYVCIDDPMVNVDRVADRVSKAGHNVPVEKIVSRYHRSLSNAVSALPFTNRAYFWDNSGTSHKYLGEITESPEPGENLDSTSYWNIDIAVDELPFWFEDQILNQL